MHAGRCWKGSNGSTKYPDRIIPPGRDRYQEPSPHSARQTLSRHLACRLDANQGIAAVHFPFFPFSLFPFFLLPSLHRKPATPHQCLSRGVTNSPPSWYCLRREVKLLRNPHHTRDLTKLPPQFGPGVSTIIAAIQISVAAAGENDIGVGRLHLHHPHGRVGLHR